MTAPIDASGTVPVEYSANIIQDVTQQSAALALGTRVPMGSSITQMPVPKTMPAAAFVTAGGRKPFTDLSFENATLTAEEIACVISIPDSYLEDSAINLWAYARPLLAEALATTFDNAVFWGTGAPATYPVGGIAAAAHSVPAPVGVDPIDQVNQAMSAVEAQGVPVTGNAADITVRGALRGVRDSNGALLLGPNQVNGPANAGSIYEVPTYYSSFAIAAPADFITGNWRYLLIGVRQDIRYEMSDQGVIADGAGKVIASAFQDNQTFLKVWARLAVAIVNPVTSKVPAGAKPFSIASVVGAGSLPLAAATQPADQNAPRPAN